MAERTLVLRDGLIVEEGPSQVLFDHPEHPFTRALVAALPRLEKGSPGSSPLPGDRTTGSREPA